MRSVLTNNNYWYLWSYPLLILFLLIFFPPESESQHQPQPQAVAETTDDSGNSAQQDEHSNEDSSNSEENSEGEAEPPKLSIDPEKLFDEIAPLINGENFQELEKRLREHKDVVEAEQRFLEPYIKALLASKKIDWPEVQRYASRLVGADPKNPWGNLALGRYYSEGAKKIDLSKALKHLSTAKSAKKPPQGATTLYWIVFFKKFGIPIGLGVGLIIVIAVKKLKNKKASQQPTEKKDSEVASQSEALSTEKPENLQNVIDAKKEEKTTTTQTRSSSPPPATPKPPQPSSPPSQPSPPPKPPTLPPKPPTTEKSVEPSPTLPQQLEVTETILHTKPEKPAISTKELPPTIAEALQASESLLKEDLPTISPTQIQPVVAQPVTENSPVSTKQPSPTINKVDEPNKTPSPTPTTINIGEFVTVEMDLSAAAGTKLGTSLYPELKSDRELEARWEKLRKKAEQKPLPLDFRPPSTSNQVTNNQQSTPDNSISEARKIEKQKEIEAFFKQRENSSTHEFSFKEVTSKENEADIETQVKKTEDEIPIEIQMSNVTLDLSEESLKENLIDKLKMTAIEDGELRKLLQERNPQHLPAIIEFMMMKPEPVKLAFIARELGGYHDPAVVDVLSGFLHHEDNRVVVACIEGLKTNGGNEAILAICPFVQSDVPAVSEAAKNALISFGPKKVLTALMNLPNHPDEKIREAGVFILSRMKSKLVDELLLTLLKDKSPKVRKKTIMAMVFQKNPIFIGALREAFRSGSDEEEKKLARKAIVYLQTFVPKPNLTSNK